MVLTADELRPSVLSCWGWGPCRLSVHYIHEHVLSSLMNLPMMPHFLLVCVNMLLQADPGFSPLTPQKCGFGLKPAGLLDRPARPSVLLSTTVNPAKRTVALAVLRLCREEHQRVLRSSCNPGGLSPAPLLGADRSVLHWQVTQLPPQCTCSPLD